ncbi:hypothetical protein, conserved [Babesia bigemina]|uniref:YGGT family protein n=1 Tax=Babesia bigemina TaxID=5866 RepID=A0A061DC00_BABBI|nr:hypothetical protein, conserved [Babesia bigemina]CDR97517.1 hypothetical protein, conserved [Babesia bigemina]|eukprot:XP_012769703.1 hypothetical protein, conserved [Babesia bigemina]
MRALLTLSVLLPAVCVSATRYCNSLQASPCFLQPSSALKQGVYCSGWHRPRKVQTRACGGASPPVALSQVTAPKPTAWERALLQTWKDHGAGIVLGAVYGIRIFRFLLHVRNLLEWLPQVNPYLFPFDAVYQATDAYLKLFQAAIPALYGMDISGIVAFFVLDHIESLLAHKPEVAQHALQ